MRQLRTASTILLLALASLASALPVPPFGEVGEAVSVLVALGLLGLVLRFSPARRWSFARTTILLLAVVLARVFVEAGWMWALGALPHGFFILPRLLGADGEGAHNTATYQVFLLVVSGAAVAIAACRPRIRSRPRPPGRAASPGRRAGQARH